MATQSNAKNHKAKNDKIAPAAPKAPVAPPAKVTKARDSYEPTQEEIQTRAFELYVSEGCKENNDLEYWLRAEKELRVQGSR